jgi:predicted SnoaL-like aldol condensation-catalyzing enzyme
MNQTLQETNKALVIKAFNLLFNARDMAAAAPLWSKDYIQHSAVVPTGRDGLFNFVSSLPAGGKYEIAEAMAEGDRVMLHGRYSGTGQPTNWIAVDIVRVENGILVEHWDVIQNEATMEQSLGGQPMFGSTFPA